MVGSYPLSSQAPTPVEVELGCDNWCVHLLKCMSIPVQNLLFNNCNKICSTICSFCKYKFEYSVYPDIYILIAQIIILIENFCTKNGIWYKCDESINHSFIIHLFVQLVQLGSTLLLYHICTCVKDPVVDRPAQLILCIWTVRPCIARKLVSLKSKKWPNGDVKERNSSLGNFYSKLWQ